MDERLKARLGLGLLIVGGALFTLWTSVMLEASGFQQRLGRRLEALGAPRDQPDGLTRAAGTRREAQSSGLVGRIEIERVGLSAIVVEGTTATALRRGVGHVSGTAYPGEAGNVALAGHRDSFFRLLSQVESGDRITLTTPDGCFAYLVDSVLVVGPRRGDLLRGNHEPRLTLVTCYPFYYVGPAPRRFVVVAHALEEAGKAARTESPSTPGGPTYVASAIR